MNPGKNIAVAKSNDQKFAPLVLNANLYFFAWMSFGTVRNGVCQHFLEFAQVDANQNIHTATLILTFLLLNFPLPIDIRCSRHE
jgi:hypothetical protein